MSREARPGAAPKTALHLPPQPPAPPGSPSALRGRGKSCPVPAPRSREGGDLLFFCAPAKRLLAFQTVVSRQKVETGELWHICEGMGAVWGWVVVSG